MTKINVFALEATIGINLDNFNRGLEEAKGKAKSFVSSVEGFSKSMESAWKGTKEVFEPAIKGFQAVESVGKKAGNAIMSGLKGFGAASAVVGGFGATAVNAGMQFDATMSEVSAISGATGKEFDSLRAKALEMGAKTKFSASEAAEAMTYMGMAGWKTQDMLDGIPGIMNLAAASGEDLATTSDIVTDALTAFGMSAKESGHFADILAAASTNSNTNVGMMGETFKYVAPVAGALGYSAEDAAIAIGLMANSGIKASQSGTAMRSILTRLAKPTKESAVAMEELGISLDDGEGNMKSFKQIMDDLRGGFGELMVPQDEFRDRLSELNIQLESGEIKQKAYDKEVERLIGLAYGAEGAEKAKYAAMLAGQEAMSGLLAIVSASDEDYQKLTNSIYECNGAAEEMSRVMMDNLAGDIQYFKSALESLQIAISDSLTPTLREFAQFGQKAMAQLLEGFQSAGTSGFFSALTDIVTQAVTFLSEKAPMFAEVSMRFIESLATGILNARNQIIDSAQQIFGTLMSGLDSWLSAHTQDLFEFGVYILNNLFRAFTDAGSLIAKYIGDFVPLIAQAFFDYHEALFEVGLEILAAIGRGIVENKDDITGIVSEFIWNLVDALQKHASDIIDGAVALLDAFVDAVISNMPKIMEAGREIVSKLIDGISGSIPAITVVVGAITATIIKIVSVADDVGKGFKRLSELFSSEGGSMHNVIERIGGIFSKVQGAISKGISLIISIGGKLKAGISGLFSLIAAHPVIAVVTAIIAAVVLLYNKCEWFRNAVQPLLEALGELIKALAPILQPILELAIKGLTLIVNGVTAVANAFKDFCGWLDKTFGPIIGAVMSIWKKDSKQAEDVAKDIKKPFKNMPDDMKKTGKDTSDGFFSGLKKGAHGILAWAGQLVKDIKAKFTNKRGFDTHSPSKWAKKVFENVLEGGIEGLKSKTKAITSAAEKAVGDVKDNLAIDPLAVDTEDGGFVEYLQTLRDEFILFLEDCQESITNFGEWLTERITTFNEWFSEILTGISSSVTAIQTSFQEIWTGIEETWGTAPEWFAEICENIRLVFETLTAAIVELFTAAVTSIQEIFTSLQEAFTAVCEGLQELWTQASTFFTETFTAAVDAVKEAWDTILDFFSEIWEGIVGIFEVAPQWFGETFTAALESLQEAFDPVIDYFTTTWENIVAVFGDAIDRFAEVGNNIITGLHDGIESGRETLLQLMEEIKQALLDIINSLTDEVQSVATEAMNQLGESVSSAVSEMKSEVDGLISKIAEALSKLEAAREKTKALEEKAKAAEKAAEEKAKKAEEKANEAKEKAGNVAKAVTDTAKKANDTLKKVATGKTPTQLLREEKAGYGKTNYSKATPSQINRQDKVTKKTNPNGYVSTSILRQTQKTLTPSQINRLDKQMSKGVGFGGGGAGSGAGRATGNGFGGGGGRGGGAGRSNTFNITINSPKALNEVQAARELKKASQQIALGY